MGGNLLEIHSLAYVALVRTASYVIAANRSTIRLGHGGDPRQQRAAASRFRAFVANEAIARLARLLRLVCLPSSSRHDLIASSGYWMMRTEDDVGVEGGGVLVILCVGSASINRRGG